MTVDANKAAELNTLAQTDSTVSAEKAAELNTLAAEKVPAEKAVELNRLAQGHTATTKRQEVITGFINNPNGENSAKIKLLSKVDGASDPAIDAQANDVSQFEQFIDTIPTSKKELEQVMQSGGVGALADIITDKIIKTVNPEAYERQQQTEAFGRKQEVREKWNEINAPILDEIDRLEAQGGDAQQIKALDALVSENARLQRLEIAGELDPEIEDATIGESISQITDAIVSNPGIALGELTNALIADPELFLVPGGYVRVAATINNRLAGLAKVGKAGIAAQKTASVAAGSVAAGSLAGGLEVGIEGAKQINETGELDSQKLLTAGGTGLAVGTVLGPLSGVSAQGLKRAGAKVKELGEDVVRKRAEKVNREGKSDSEVLDEALNEDGSKRSEVKEFSSDIGSVGAAQTRTPILQKILGKKGAEIARRKKESFGGFLEDIAAPIATRVSNIDKNLGLRFKKFDQDVAIKVNKNRGRVESFVRGFKKLDNDTREQVDLALKNQRLGDAVKILRKQKNGDDLVEGLRESLRVTNELRDQALKVGVKVPFKKNHFPRSVKDFDGLEDALGNTRATKYQELVRKAREAKNGEDLTQFEKSELLAKAISSEASAFKTPGSARKRTIEKVSPELNQFYNDSAGGLLRYIEEFSDAVETRKFFKELGGKSENTADNIFDVMGNLENLPFRAQRELESLLKARFIEAHAPGDNITGVVKTLRGTATLATLGNLTNTVTQLGDLFITAYRSGALRTVKSAITPKKVTVEDIGVFKIAQEFSDMGKINKFVDQVFDVTRFKRVDRWAKETLINASFDKAVGQVAKPKGIKKFALEHAETFGDQFDDLVDAMKRKDLTDENVKLFLWNELSKNQPISMAEMPLKYLQNPNGRIFYTLKTFTLKILDIYRREVFGEIANGNAVKGLQNGVRLTALMWLGGMTADTIKDFILGRDTEFSDAAIDNLWAVVGLSKFVVDRANRQGVGDTAALQLASAPFMGIQLPVNVLTDVIEAANDDEKEVLEQSSLRRIPIIGNVFEMVQRSNDEDDE